MFLQSKKYFKMIKFLFTLFTIFWTFEISAQKVEPYSFQDFRLGMTLENFKNSYPQSKSGQYEKDCESVRFLKMEIPQSEIDSINFLYLSLIKNTESGDKIYITLTFYENKLGFINVIYSKPQILQYFIDGLRDKYGKEVKMYETGYNQQYVHYDWNNLNYKMGFLFDNSFDCKMNSELWFRDEETIKAYREAHRNARLKYYKKRIE